MMKTPTWGANDAGGGRKGAIPARVYPVPRHGAGMTGGMAGSMRLLRVARNDETPDVRRDDKVGDGFLQKPIPVGILPP